MERSGMEAAALFLLFCKTVSVKCQPMTIDYAAKNMIVGLSQVCPFILAN